MQKRFTPFPGRISLNCPPQTCGPKRSTVEIRGFIEDHIAVGPPACLRVHGYVCGNRHAVKRAHVQERDRHPPGAEIG